MDGAMEDLQDMFIVHNIEEIQVSQTRQHKNGLVMKNHTLKYEWFPPRVRV